MSEDFLAGFADVRAKRQKQAADDLLTPKRSGDEDSEEEEKQAKWQGLDEDKDDNDRVGYKHPHNTCHHPKQAPPNTEEMDISSSDDHDDEINSCNGEGEEDEEDKQATPRRKTPTSKMPTTPTPRAPQPKKQRYLGLALAAATIVHGHDRDELFADDAAWQ